MSNKSYKTLITLDGSTTYIDPVSGQTMHAKEGALSETLYIYGEAYLKSKEIETPDSIAVVGLGMGYIEFSIFSLYLKHHSNLPKPKFFSFEIDKELKNDFTQWLTGKSVEYINSIFLNTANTVGIDSNKLKDICVESFTNKSWQILDDFRASYSEIPKVGLICFDPYSKSANSDLWEQDFLTGMLTKISADSCVFASYASNGHIKKALRKSGFQNLKKSGFHLKKESTLAVKN